MPDRKLIVTENVSANGVIEFDERWFRPRSEEDDVELATVQQAQMAKESGLLLGRRTFEDFRGYWPHQSGDATGSTAHLNAVPKFVVSRTMTDPQWDNSTIVNGDLVEAVAALKADGDGELGITGSISVVHELFEAGLVDGVRLFVYPTVTGRGRGLIPVGMSMQEFTLSECRAFRSEVAMLCYERH